MKVPKGGIAELQVRTPSGEYNDGEGRVILGGSLETNSQNAERQKKNGTSRSRGNVAPEKKISTPVRLTTKRPQFREGAVCSRETSTRGGG